MNRVTIVGNLGVDPEIRYMDGGNAKLRLRVATNDKFKDRDGNYQERTEWHTANVWGKRAEGMSKFLRKGFTVLIEGSLKTTSWEKDGIKRYSTEISVRDLEVLGRPSDRGNADQGDTIGNDIDAFGTDEIPF